ncbi:MAG: NAD(P)-dependent oxidoreductase [Cytophagales bacterium]|nr:NAD(P)-dependent oxidoreductase [Armatimonadota bacterium]
MRILVIGGAGHVGGLVLPFLGEHHSLRVFDLRPPADPPPGTEFVRGDVTDSAALTEAMAGIEAVLYMAMGTPPRDQARGAVAASAFDVNTKGVYLALLAASQAGITQAVYTSSLSVYHAVGGGGKGESRYYVDEDLPPDARSLYGFTKRLGEEVCRNAARQWQMNVNALRLCFPVSEAKWLEEARVGTPTIATAAPDVSRALLAALEFRAGFQAFTISGDYEQKLMRLDKARQLLGWEPQSRPRDPSSDLPGDKSADRPA